MDMNWWSSTFRDFVLVLLGAVIVLHEMLFVNSAPRVELLVLATGLFVSPTAIKADKKRQEKKPDEKEEDQW